MNRNTMTDQPYLIRPCTIIYILLITLTFLSWLIGKSGVSSLHVAMLVLLLALLKGLLIGDYFMGLRSVRGVWRWPIIIWLFVPGSLITWAFFISA